MGVASEEYAAASGRPVQGDKKKARTNQPKQAERPGRFIPVRTYPRALLLPYISSRDRISQSYTQCSSRDDPGWSEPRSGTGRSTMMLSAGAGELQEHRRPPPSFGGSPPPTSRICPGKGLRRPTSRCAPSSRKSSAMCSRSIPRICGCRPGGRPRSPWRARSPCTSPMSATLDPDRGRTAVRAGPDDRFPCLRRRRVEARRWGVRRGRDPARPDRARDERRAARGRGGATSVDGRARPHAEEPVLSPKTGASGRQSRALRGKNRRDRHRTLT